MAHNVVIIGSGPAGYTAAIYLGRAGLNPLMITGALAPGGQLVNTTEVENFPGFPEGILGPDLMDNMREQAKRFGTEFVADDVTAIASVGTDNAPLYRLELSDDEVLETRAVIIATGSKFRKLGVPGEVELSGHGVSYCATCDGFFFRNKPIVVVGGGDSAFEEALFLTRFGSSVTLIHRRDEFRASQIMVDRAKENPKLNLLTNTVVTEIHGKETAPAAIPASLPGIGLKPKPQVNVSSVSLKNTVTGETSELETAAVFVAIGHTPATDFAASVVDRDEDGYILVDGASTRTSTPGIFAAGDCVDRVYRQAISAAGMGCRAALDAQEYLSE
ncbi:thioredoxin-disulfide reductase [Bifidobacterium saguini DSM 23967]|uniref:Thioredoxin-disulfide reductase n=2 Tax=Bifidobacterium saguini TaxID=762210 RepID=A0A087D897_9BIFI|nr:thioredoxin-disulfide reductase [Bifidobacterium saguini]KFI91747.1 thioredoxin-disulfide reductase [Bifidobacterium saguini DSM 23967]QTB89966.1 thioredoxin-disulfide reductase [Bifidobacterium saguini]